MNNFTKADSASLYGSVNLGHQTYLAQGAILRSVPEGIAIGHGSAVLENCVLVGHPELKTTVGRKVVFGHRTFIIGATIGDLCEIGNGCILMPGSTLGNWCILGEGTLIPEGMIVPEYSVVVGRPGRIIRSLTEEDQAMISRMRGDDISLPERADQIVQGLLTEGTPMGKVYSYKNKSPQIAETTFLFDSSEITGDVIIGEHCVIGAGVKIIGDSHGPVRIGNHVQILENTVLHLLPDNQLILEDHVIIGPGCMIHGCEIGECTVVEPGSIVCDSSKVGKHSIVKAGTLVKQRSNFPDYSILEGFPAKQNDTLTRSPENPKWTFNFNDLRTLR